MDRDLVRYTRSEVRRRRMRGAPPQSRLVYEEVRLAGLKADGSMALTAHIMEGAVELDALRRELGGGDATMHVLLAEFEATGVQQVKRIQRSLFNDWGI